VKAKQLLADDEISIAEIGHRLGFASRSHFSTAFRRRVGSTPREFRLTGAKERFGRTPYSGSAAKDAKQ
jgi:AraC-like DNA-binding protein